MKRKCLKNIFSAEFKSVNIFYCFTKRLLRARSRCWLSDPFVSGISWIAFIVIFFFFKCNSENMARMGGRPFPPDPECTLSH